MNKTEKKILKSAKKTFKSTCVFGECRWCTLGETQNHKRLGCASYLIDVLLRGKNIEYVEHFGNVDLQELFSNIKDMNTNNAGLEYFALEEKNPFGYIWSVYRFETTKK